MSEKSNSPRCDRCRFFDNCTPQNMLGEPVMSEGMTEYFGICHRLPPFVPLKAKLDEAPNAAHPRVHGNNWCGEFQSIARATRHDGLSLKAWLRLNGQDSGSRACAEIEGYLRMLQSGLSKEQIVASRKPRPKGEHVIRSIDLAWQYFTESRNGLTD